jgi:molecular chaperone GrpE (heat shock protein)
VINFEEEIANYKKIELNAVAEYEENENQNIITNEFDDILINMLKKVDSDYEKIGKQNNRAVSKIDEIIEILEEHEEKLEEKSDELRDIKDKNKKLYEGIINILDLIEGVYLYSQNASEISHGFKTQIDMLWESIYKELIKIGIIRIGEIGDNFDAKLYNAVGVENIETKEKNEILKIVKYGYASNADIMRKADVIVNMK